MSLASEILLLKILLFATTAFLARAEILLVVRSRRLRRALQLPKVASRSIGFRRTDAAPVFFKPIAPVPSVEFVAAMKALGFRKEEALTRFKSVDPTEALATQVRQALRVKA